MTTERYCCYIDPCTDEGCKAKVDFLITGQAGFEDTTDACERHVGLLLGTPMWAKNENQCWDIEVV